MDEVIIETMNRDSAHSKKVLTSTAERDRLEIGWNGESGQNPHQVILIKDN